MPNRIIKESIRTSRKINALSDFQFRLWTYLITFVDDYGRGDADPEIIKGLVFPRRKRVTESDIKTALADLAGTGCIRLYEIDGESYFCFPNWSEHQRVQNKKSKYPEPPEMTERQEFSDFHGESPSSTVSHRESPSESNPIQTESNQNPNPNPNLNPNSPYSPPRGRESGEKGGREVQTASGTGREKPVSCSTALIQRRFAEFWAAYPKKVGKGAAERMWNKLRPNQQVFESILQAVELQRRCPQWTRDDGQYIPNPATWLNQRRWEDEPVAGTGGNHALETDNIFLKMLAQEQNGGALR